MRLSAPARDAAILAEVAQRGGVVPSVRQMSDALLWPRSTVHGCYQRLGLRAVPVRSGRRDYPQLHPRVSPTHFDVIARVASCRGLSVTAATEELLAGIVERLRDRYPLMLDTLDTPTVHSPMRPAPSKGDGLSSASGAR